MRCTEELTGDVGIERRHSGRRQDGQSLRPMVRRPSPVSGGGDLQSHRVARGGTRGRISGRPRVRNVGNRWSPTPTSTLSASARRRTSTWTQVRAALAAGKHVLCEKPMANDVDQCREMVELGRAARSKMMVGFQMRFHPVVTTVDRLLPRIGPIYHVDFNFSLYRPGVTWRHRLLQGGGVLKELSSHLFDLMQHWAGPVATIAGQNRIIETGREVEDYSSNQLEFAGGASGLLFSSYHDRRSPCIRGNLMGLAGQIDFQFSSYDPADSRVTLYADDARTDSRADSRRDRRRLSRPPRQLPTRDRPFRRLHPLRPAAAGRRPKTAIGPWKSSTPRTNPRVAAGSRFACRLPVSIPHVWPRVFDRSQGRTSDHVSRTVHWR